VPEPRITTPTRLVLQAFIQARLEDAQSELYGAEICQQTDLGPGTVYPIITRLLNLGWLEDRWEQDEASQLSRPPRRYYRLTSTGAVTAQAALIEAAERRGKSSKALGGAVPEWGV
jgi:PadR family transcriptional regulator PadR